MKIRLPQLVCVLDLETEKTDFKHPENSKLAFVGTKVYTFHNGRYYPSRHRYFLPDQMAELETYLREFRGIIVGHNILEFDYRVLRPLLSLQGIVEKIVDTLAVLHQSRGGQFGGISLDALARANLGKAKTIDGKLVSRLWREGKRKRVIKYNETDCILTESLWLLLVRDLSVRISYYDKFQQYQIDETLTLRSRDISYLVGRKSFLTFPKWQRTIQEGKAILSKTGPVRFLQVRCGNGFADVPFAGCPKCGGKNLEKFDELRDGLGMRRMSDGLLMEYMDGTWGTIHCFDCKRWMAYRYGGIYDSWTELEEKKRRKLRAEGALLLPGAIILPRQKRKRRR